MDDNYGEHVLSMVEVPVPTDTSSLDQTHGSSTIDSSTIDSSALSDLGTSPSNILPPANNIISDVRGAPEFTSPGDRRVLLVSRLTSPLVKAR